MAKFEIQIVDRAGKQFYVTVTPPKQKFKVIGAEPKSHTYLDACTAYTTIFIDRVKAFNPPPATKKGRITIVIADTDHGGAGCEFKPSARELIAERKRLGDEACPQSLLLATDLVQVILAVKRETIKAGALISADEIHEMGGAIGVVKDVMTGKKSH